MLDLESLFKLSYGMCIINSKKADKFNGCIVNTAFQFTPEPPMLAVSVYRKCLTHEYITDSKVFTISILAQDTPMQFIGTFGFKSGRDINKFQNVNYKLGQTGTPIILDNTVAFIEAQVTQHIDVETHTLFIAKIIACETLDVDSEPLTYAYYRDIKHGKTPKSAATYIKVKPKQKAAKGAKTMAKYKCLVCGYIYDPAAGDPENDVDPGTAFENLPDDWVCPECGADKSQFEKVEED